MRAAKPTRGLLGALGLTGAIITGCGDSGGDDQATSADTTSDSGSGSSDESAGTDTETETDTGTETGDELCPSQGVDLDSPPPQLLSELCLVRWTGDQLEYEDNVFAYDLNTVLFSDFALKDRAIYIPPGETASYVDNGVIDFPVGTVILKSFMFPADMREPELDIDLIETRLLIRYPNEWKGYPYIWDHELGDAVLTVQGEVRPIDFIGPDGIERTATYLVPQKNQCLECHEVKDELDETVVVPIGPRPRYLNRESHVVPGTNQMTVFTDAGWLTGVPAIDELPKAWDHRSLANTPVDQMDYATITTAARDYLDINCSYCHNPRGVNGISSQLFLNWDNEDLFHLGYCKKPGSAGKGGENREFDIVPGDAEASILVYRTETLDLGSMMPLIGRSLAHEDGTELLRAWIDGLPPDDCQEPPEP
ncbi:hypothetical protein DB30_00110 [Enhygromyxa salina]|uniref:Cytochrome c domain-containing protein n=1 Tax=Enhygromyxa salina TaxID=215803 RepID=A0A0C2D960_9BACT|nr:SO2930 family diheme c-type cytochrome [Enhygromyxa salina]KIG19601.1 hypothetical protein DB30_00110 [Enhygromyxa salina]